MKKLIITTDGSVGLIEGGNVPGSYLTYTREDGTIDKVIEEYDVSGMPEEELKKVREGKKVKDLDKYLVKNIYKRGVNQIEDARRDEIDNLPQSTANRPG